jgi:hypothetical protein
MVGWPGAAQDHLPAHARADIMAFTAFPKEVWRQVWSINPLSQPRDPQTHRRRRDLPRPGRPHPARRRDPSQAARRGPRYAAYVGGHGPVKLPATISDIRRSQPGDWQTHVSQPVQMTRVTRTRSSGSYTRNVTRPACPKGRVRSGRPLRLTRPTLVLRRVHNHDGVHEVRQRKLRLRRHSGELLAGQVLQLPPEQGQAPSCARNSSRVTRCSGPGGPSARYRSIRARNPRCPAGSRCHSSASIHHRRTAVVSTLRSPVSRARANAASSSFSYCATTSGTALAASTALIAAGVSAGRPATGGSWCCAVMQVSIARHADSHRTRETPDAWPQRDPDGGAGHDLPNSSTPSRR